MADEDGEAETAPSFLDPSLKQLTKFQADDCRWIQEHTKNMILYDRGLGKAQPLDASILTPTGWVTMESISVGAKVICPDGSITHVESLHPQGMKDVYGITLNDGSTTRSCIDHLWTVQTRGQRINWLRGKKGLPPVTNYRTLWNTVPLHSIIAKPLRPLGKGHYEYNNYLPLMEPTIDFTSSYSYIISPYALGLLLGDGTMRTAQSSVGFTTMDPFLLEQLIQGIPAACKVSYSGTSGQATDYKIWGLRPYLEPLGLIAQYSHEKSIPTAYKWTSAVNRLEILRGLMDTDGTVHSGQTAMFNSSSKQLADDVVFLAQSLGGRASISLRDSPVRNNTGLLAYNISVKLPYGVNPFKLPRKHALYARDRNTEPTRAIEKVTFIEKALVQCIKLADPRGLYITDNFIVTHNTVLATQRNIEAGVGTHVVFCSSNAVATWVKHTREWWEHHRPNIDLDIHVVRGTPDQRKKMWDELLRPERTRQHRLFVQVFGSMQRDTKNVLTRAHYKNVDQFDVDEAQKMRNRNSQNFKCLQPILRYHGYFSFLTGSPISRGAQEFWTYLNCINPRYFSSYWKHVYTFCEVMDGRWGKEIIGPKNEGAFGHLLNQYARIRLKTDPLIAAQLPRRLPRNPIFVEMDADQQRIYQELDLSKVSFTDDGLILASTSMEQIMRFRQLLVCPRMFSDSLSLGAAFNDYLDMMEDADADERHNVVFTPFKRAFPHFRSALEQRGYSVAQLSGGITADEQQAQIRAFRASRGVILCTIPYAESFSLEPATSSYFIGYEWDPFQNGQAEDRLLRLTSRVPVQANYYRYSGTIDDGICYVVNWKSQAVHDIHQLPRDYAE